MLNKRAIIAVQRASAREFPRLRAKLHLQYKPSDKKDYGCSCHGHICLFGKEGWNIETVIHELAHLAGPRYEMHTLGFYKRMVRLFELSCERGILKCRTKR